MKRKLFLAIFILSLVFNLFAVPVSAQDEMTPDEAALFLKDKGLLQGDNGNLMLDQALTREQMMVIVSRLLNAENTAINYPLNKMTFKDVPKNNWAAPYIAWAQANKITEGYSSQQFGLNDNLTGWQTKAFFVRTLGYYPADSEIEAKAIALGITRGSTAVSDKAILRRDMSLLMYNTLYAKTSKGQVLGEKLGVINLSLPSNQ